MDDFPRDHQQDQDVRIKRRTHRMHDFLAPAQDQANMVLFCHAYAATSHAQVISALMTTTNELDVLVTDTCGARADYTELCHGILARGRNQQLERYDSLFTRGCPDETVILDAEHALEQLAELYCRPVELNLVQEISHWDGAKLLPEHWGNPMRVQRPKAFDSERTRLPAMIEFTPMPPRVLLRAYGLARSIELAQQAIRRRTDELNSWRAERTGSSRVLGRSRCNRLDPLARRGNPDRPPRSPHFAGSKKRVAQALREMRRKRKFYAECRETFRCSYGKGVVFPSGTVMFRKLGAFCDPLSPSRVTIPPFRHYDTLPPPACSDRNGQSRASSLAR